MNNSDYVKFLPVHIRPITLPRNDQASSSSNILHKIQSALGITEIALPQIGASACNSKVMDR
jgi:hypothetical protein